MAFALPNVVGQNRKAAEEQLKLAGASNIGVVKVHNSTIPAGQVISMNPPAGSSASAEDLVTLQIAQSENAISSITEALASNANTLIYVGLAVLVLAGIAIGLYNSNTNLLYSLADKDVARGLITFLIAFTTVCLALVLLISSITLEVSQESAARFDRGKQVLTMLIGILGTIVGFYYGSTTTVPAAQVSASGPKIITTTLADARVNNSYQAKLAKAGLNDPVVWTVVPALPAGLVLDPATGALSGNPTAQSPKTTYQFTVAEGNDPSKKTASNLTLEVTR